MQLSLHNAHSVVARTASHNGSTWTELTIAFDDGSPEFVVVLHHKHDDLTLDLTKLDAQVTLRKE